MIELRQYIPADKVGDPEFEGRIVTFICEELSRQAAPDDNPYMYSSEAMLNVTKRTSRKGGVWVHSFLNRKPKADYLDPLYKAPFKVPVPFAKEHDPVDFTEEELAIHLRQKEARRGSQD